MSSPRLSLKNAKDQDASNPSIHNQQKPHQPKLYTKEQMIKIYNNSPSQITLHGHKKNSKQLSKDRSRAGYKPNETITTNNQGMRKLSLDNQQQNVSPGGINNYSSTGRIINNNSSLLLLKQQQTSPLNQNQKNLKLTNSPSVNTYQNLNQNKSGDILLTGAGGRITNLSHISSHQESPSIRSPKKSSSKAAVYKKYSPDPQMQISESVLKMKQEQILQQQHLTSQGQKMNDNSESYLSGGMGHNTGMIYNPSQTQILSGTYQPQQYMLSTFQGQSHPHNDYQLFMHTDPSSQNLMAKGNNLIPLYGNMAEANKIIHKMKQYSSKIKNIINPVLLQSLQNNSQSIGADRIDELLSETQHGAYTLRHQSIRHSLQTNPNNGDQANDNDYAIPQALKTSTQNFLNQQANNMIGSNMSNVSGHTFVYNHPAEKQIFNQTAANGFSKHGKQTIKKQTKGDHNIKYQKSSIPPSDTVQDYKLKDSRIVHNAKPYKIPMNLPAHLNQPTQQHQVANSVDLTNQHDNPFGLLPQHLQEPALLNEIQSVNTYAREKKHYADKKRVRRFKVEQHLKNVSGGELDGSDTICYVTDNQYIHSLIKECQDLGWFNVKLQNINLVDLQWTSSYASLMKPDDFESLEVYQNYFSPSLEQSLAQILQDITALYPENSYDNLMQLSTEPQKQRNTLQSPKSNQTIVTNLEDTVHNENKQKLFLTIPIFLRRVKPYPKAYLIKGQNFFKLGSNIYEHKDIFKLLQEHQDSDLQGNFLQEASDFYVQANEIIYTIVNELANIYNSQDSATPSSKQMFQIIEFEFGIQNACGQYLPQLVKINENLDYSSYIKNDQLNQCITVLLQKLDIKFRKFNNCQYNDKHKGVKEFSKLWTKLCDNETTQKAMYATKNLEILGIDPTKAKKEDATKKDKIAPHTIQQSLDSMQSNNLQYKDLMSQISDKDRQKLQVDNTLMSQFMSVADSQTEYNYNNEQYRERMMQDQNKVQQMNQPNQQVLNQPQLLIKEDGKDTQLDLKLKAIIRLQCFFRQVLARKRLRLRQGLYLLIDRLAHHQQRVHFKAFEQNYKQTLDILPEKTKRENIDLYHGNHSLYTETQMAYMEGNINPHEHQHHANTRYGSFLPSEDITDMVGKHPAHKYKVKSNLKNHDFLFQQDVQQQLAQGANMYQTNTDKMFQVNHPDIRYGQIQLKHPVQFLEENYQTDVQVNEMIRNSRNMQHGGANLLSNQPNVTNNSSSFMPTYDQSENNYGMKKKHYVEVQSQQVKRASQEKIRASQMKKKNMQQYSKKLENGGDYQSEKSIPNDSIDDNDVVISNDIIFKHHDKFNKTSDIKQKAFVINLPESISSSIQIDSKEHDPKELLEKILKEQQKIKDSKVKQSAALKNAKKNQSISPKGSKDQLLPSINKSRDKGNPLKKSGNKKSQTLRKSKNQTIDHDRGTAIIDNGMAFFGMRNAGGNQTVQQQPVKYTDGKFNYHYDSSVTRVLQKYNQVKDIMQKNESRRMINTLTHTPSKKAGVSLNQNSAKKANPRDVQPLEQYIDQHINKSIWKRKESKTKFYQPNKTKDQDNFYLSSTVKNVNNDEYINQINYLESPMNGQQMQNSPSKIKISELTKNGQNYALQFPLYQQQQQQLEEQEQVIQQVEDNQTGVNVSKDYSQASTQNVTSNKVSKLEDLSPVNHNYIGQQPKAATQNQSVLDNIVGVKKLKNQYKYHGSQFSQQMSALHSSNSRPGGGLVNNHVSAFTQKFNQQKQQRIKNQQMQGKNYSISPSKANLNANNELYFPVLEQQKQQQQFINEFVSSKKQQSHSKNKSTIDQQYHDAGASGSTQAQQYSSQQMKYNTSSSQPKISKYDLNNTISTSGMGNMNAPSYAKIKQSKNRLGAAFI